MLVAGGLGERLGFSGIKLALPVESASRKCFLQVKALLHCLLYVGSHVMLSMHVRLLYDQHDEHHKKHPHEHHHGLL